VFGHRHCAFLAKPFNGMTLCRVIEKLLEVSAEAPNTAE
jgi:hypothetical protein